MKKLLPLLLCLFTLNLFGQDLGSDFRIVDPQDSVVNTFPSLNSEGCQVIRVVFHVVTDGTDNFSSGWISENQIKSQIRAANQFFRNDSSFYHIDNAGLPFTVRLAEYDPNGLPTNGINYYDGFELFGQDYADNGLNNSNSDGVSASEMANTLAWGADIDGEKYINCYVVNRIDGGAGGGTQAYAYFPTANVVFGNYNLYNVIGYRDMQDEYDEFFNLKSYTDEGLTWIHELLHNFAIFHTFQGNSCGEETNCIIQGDRVCDTDPQTKGIGCSGSCGFLSENIMDYISQSCKHKITEGQRERATLAINNSLSQYLVCPECQPNTDGDLNGDGEVSITDISLMNTVFGCSEGDDCYDDWFDYNCDGEINITDVSTWNSFFVTEVVRFNMIGEKVDRNYRGWVVIKYSDGSRKLFNISDLTTHSKVR